MPDFELFQLYLHHVTPNSFLFFVEKTRFAFCFVYSLNATSPGPLLKNRILMLVHGTPVLMSHPHSWCPRITKIGDTRTHAQAFLACPHTRAPAGQLDYTRRARVGPAKGPIF